MVLSIRLRAWAALVVAATQTATVLGHPFINTSPRAAADCSKEVLQAAADAYVAAQTAGNVTLLEGVVATAGWEYEQNNKKMEAKAGVLGKALKPDHRRTNFDLVACATYTELISASDPANPYVMGVQLRHRVEDGKVVLIDVIASTTDSWLFNATKTLEYVRQEKWDVIPEEKRDKREVIKAAGDAYMDMWNDSTAADKVPWGTPCTRLEGSAYTGRGQPDDSCKAGIPSNHNQAPNTRRRYVIDEAMGSITIFCVWEHMMMAADSHEFRLENGKLRYVHTMTECGGRQCRL